MPYPTEFQAKGRKEPFEVTSAFFKGCRKILEGSNPGDSPYRGGCSYGSKALAIGTDKVLKNLARNEDRCNPEELPSYLAKFHFTLLEDLGVGASR